MRVDLRENVGTTLFQSAPGREAGRCAHVLNDHAQVLKVSIRARP